MTFELAFCYRFPPSAKHERGLGKGLNPTGGLQQTQVLHDYGAGDAGISCQGAIRECRAPRDAQLMSARPSWLWAGTAGFWVRRYPLRTLSRAEYLRPLYGGFPPVVMSSTTLCAFHFDQHFGGNMAMSMLKMLLCTRGALIHTPFPLSESFPQISKFWSKMSSLVPPQSDFFHGSVYVQKNVRNIP